MRNGVISYQDTDIVQREGEWHPDGKQEADLMKRYSSTLEATVKFVSKGNDGIRVVVNIPWWRKFLNCFLGFIRCMRNCFMGFLHGMRVTWAWLREHCRC